jgi:hypothetical protein
VNAATDPDVTRKIMSTDIVHDTESTKQEVESAWSSGNAPWMIMAALVVLLCIYVRVRLLSVPLERDEGEYAYFAQLMLRGVPPYLHAYTLKLPGAALMYALFMLVFGQSAWGIHLGLLIVNTMTIVLVFALGRRLFHPSAASIAAASYAVLSVSLGVFGVFAHATHFVVLFALAGILLLLRALDNGRSTILFFSGLSCGLAIIMKQHGVFFAFFALLYFLWEQKKCLPAEWRRITRQGLLFVAATMIPFGVCCLALALYGSFDKFWFWAFTYSREYVSIRPISAGVQVFLEQFLTISRSSLSLWIAAGGGIVFLFADKTVKNARVFTAGFLLFSFLAICPGFYFREHYFVMLLPAIALLNGVFAYSTRNFLARWDRGQFPRIIPALLFLLVVSFSVYQQREFFFSMSPETASRKIYGGNPFPESLPVAHYIKEHSSPNDRIAVLGSEPQIFFYSGRYSATGHIYMYGLMENQKYAATMQQELIKDIETAKPKFIVQICVDTSWLIDPDSNTMIFGWARIYLKENYRLAGVVDIFDNTTVYRWDNEAAGYTPRSDSFLYVYQRNDS